VVASRGRAFEMGGRPVAMAGRPVAMKDRPVAMGGRPVEMEDRPVAMGGSPVVLRGRANLTCMILRSRTRGSPSRHRVEATAWRH
jgi:hypothetical protein